MRKLVALGYGHESQVVGISQLSHGLGRRTENAVAIVNMLVRVKQ